MIEKSSNKTRVILGLVYTPIKYFDQGIWLMQADRKLALQYASYIKAVLNSITYQYVIIIVHIFNIGQHNLHVNSHNF